MKTKDIELGAEYAWEPKYVTPHRVIPLEIVRQPSNARRPKTEVTWVRCRFPDESDRIEDVLPSQIKQTWAEYQVAHQERVEIRKQRMWDHEAEVAELEEFLGGLGRIADGGKRVGLTGGPRVSLTLTELKAVIEANG